jgi:hypothetical protein
MKTYLLIATIAGYPLLAWTTYWIWLYLATGHDKFAGLAIVVFCLPVIIVQVLAAALPALIAFRRLTPAVAIHIGLVTGVMLAEAVVFALNPPTGSGC